MRRTIAVTLVGMALGLAMTGASRISSPRAQVDSPTGPVLQGCSDNAGEYKCRDQFTEMAPPYNEAFAKELWKISDGIRKDRRKHKDVIGESEVLRCATEEVCDENTSPSVKARIIPGTSTNAEWSKLKPGIAVAIATMDHMGGDGKEARYRLDDEPWVQERRSLVTIRQSSTPEMTTWVIFHLREGRVPGLRTYRIESTTEGKFVTCPSDTKHPFDVFAHWSGCAGKKQALDELARANPARITNAMLSSIRTGKEFAAPAWITCANGCCELDAT